MLLLSLRARHCDEAVLLHLIFHLPPTKQKGNKKKVDSSHTLNRTHDALRKFVCQVEHPLSAALHYTEL